MLCRLARPRTKLCIQVGDSVRLSASVAWWALASAMRGRAEETRHLMGGAVLASAARELHTEAMWYATSDQSGGDCEGCAASPCGATVWPRRRQYEAGLARGKQDCQARQYTMASIAELAPMCPPQFGPDRIGMPPWGRNTIMVLGKPRRWSTRRPLEAEAARRTGDQSRRAICKMRPSLLKRVLSTSSAYKCSIPNCIR